jgi:hypothetical protein
MGEGTESVPASRKPPTRVAPIRRMTKGDPWLFDGLSSRFYTSAMRVVLLPQQRRRLTEIAAQRRMTREELASQIICAYLQEDKTSANVLPVEDKRGGLGTELAALFPKHGLDFTIPELRFAMQDPFEKPKKAAGLRPADSRGRLSPHKHSLPKSPKSSSSRRKKRA